MNWAHVHLILNHIPLVALPVTLIFLWRSEVRGDWPGRRFGYIVLLLTCLFVVPVYLTGEPAEKILEKTVEVSEARIEPHEEAAEISLILTLVAGAGALAGLILGQNAKLTKLVGRCVASLTFIAILSLGYTANLGGSIRHSELNPLNETKEIQR